MANHLRRLGVGIAAIAALGATIAMPGSAQAGDKAHLGCNPATVCLYAWNRNPAPIYQTPGAPSGSRVAGSILNNGQKHVGVDHIRYRGTVRYPDGSFRSVEGCLHWREGVPTAGSSANFPTTDTLITQITWGGECAGREPPMKLGPIIN